MAALLDGMTEGRRRSVWVGGWMRSDEGLRVCDRAPPCSYTRVVECWWGRALLLWLGTGVVEGVGTGG